MNREEAIVWIKMMFAFWANTHDRNVVEAEQAKDMVITALRGPTREQELESENMELKKRIVNWRKYMTPAREQVEKVWRGEWIHTHSSDNFWTEVWKCQYCDFEDNYGGCFDFCPFCGAAHTDKAVDIIMERLEELNDGKNEA